VKTQSLCLAFLIVGAVASTAGVNDRPFDSVPKDHWAYEAIQKLRAADLDVGAPNKRLEGPATRFDIAQIVSGMVNRANVLKAGGKKFTGEDIANLEALSSEFASELAIMNGKFDRIESNLDSIRRDLAELKKNARRRGRRHRWDYPQVQYAPGQ